MSMEEEAMLYWKNQGQLSQIKLQKPTLAQLLSSSGEKCIHHSHKDRKYRYYDPLSTAKTKSQDDLISLHQKRNKVIIHNIGSNIGRNKIFQENLSELNKQLKCINLVVTCENLTIPYYWTSEVKDKYQFCFVKFDTFLPYDNEIDEDTIKDEYDMTGGMALKEMFISFSEIQKRVIMEIAILQLKNEFDKLTPKGLIDYFINTGKGTVIDVQKLETILNDPIEHGIVTLKTCSINNKEIFRVNLDKSLCERIANGEFLLND